MSNSPLILGTHAVLVIGITETFGADYDLNYDTGQVTFTSARASSESITADYTYYEVANVKITMSSYIFFKAGMPSSLVIRSNHPKTSVCRGMPLARRSFSSSCSASPGYSTLS